MATMDTERRRKLVAWAGLAVALLAVALVGLILVSGSLSLGVLGPLRLLEHDPGAGEAGMPMTAPLRLHWSGPLDAEGMEGRLRLEPAVEGRLVMTGRDALFWPREAWSPGTTYTVTVEAVVAGEGGRRSSEEQSWHFRVREPRLLYLGRTAPGDGPRQLFLAEVLEQESLGLDDKPPGIGVWRLGGRDAPPVDVGANDVVAQHAHRPADAAGATPDLEDA